MKLILNAELSKRSARLHISKSCVEHQRGTSEGAGLGKMRMNNGKYLIEKSLIYGFFVKET
jgi:hypothetical protein